ncbi:hypothetical protein LGL08_21825 [Clostridium estertheticum]|uniref:DAPG hydrolase family protein n=1 Tax=Clostridium estertheticum TaxID=238834 RepID=UPI001CF0E112|nr:hypothetical protein [Clostridium estertheticum]MCB2309210.1 hypothetical protein [Clostridium estertheticum]MCB2347573.1 hypothetical protein [Clostridium estertheticum]MCB2352166.1 hypothetical protein [Clostridium estertheticum]WAG48350.1 hypothetical protein LL127_22350 [Clostridium estertheticum]
MMDINEYLKLKTIEVPDDIRQKLKENHHVSTTDFERKNEVLQDKELQNEIGYEQLSNGDFIVSMICPMPEVTKEMVDWWFWWHPQAKERYCAWFPEEHFGIGYAKKDWSYFQQAQLPPFAPNTQYPEEKIGNLRMSLNIDFVSPEEFGYSKKVMGENNVAEIVCGHVGAYKGLIMHTEMSHVFFQKDDGLYLVSRFWMGHLLKNRLLRKIICTEKTAKTMAIHCCREYRNLAGRLPDLYKNYAEQK